MPNTDDEVKEFQIGSPVTEIPAARGGHGKYAAIYTQIEALKRDQWLPVTVDTQRQAQRLVECAKLRNYRAKRRKLTVYLAKRAAA